MKAKTEIPSHATQIRLRKLPQGHFHLARLLAVRREIDEIFDDKRSWDYARVKELDLLEEMILNDIDNYLSYAEEEANELAA